MRKIPNWILYSFAIISFLGFVDAAYLTYGHYSGDGACLNVGNVGNCETVTSSQYATVGGIPVALSGAIYYFLVFSAILYYARSLKSVNGGKRAIFDFVSRFTVLGFLASLWFVYLQIFVIKEICALCMVSAATSTGLFVLGLISIFRYGKQTA